MFNQLTSALDSLRRRFDYSLSHFPGVQYFYLMMMGVVLGILGGGGAILFRLMIGFVQRVSYSTEAPLGFVFFLQPTSNWRVWVFPLAGAVIVGIISWYLVEEVQGAGVPELLESVSLRNGRMKWYVLPAKLVASSISIGTIASIGREGPIVQIGSSLGSVVNRFANIPRRHWKLITSCGGAAGLAATFNTPIAGAFFMLEVILGSFSTENFAPIVISSVTGTVVGQWYFGTEPAFDLHETFVLHHASEFSAYLLLGIAGGLLAVAFIWTINWTREFFLTLPIPGPIRTIAGGLLLILIGLFLFPQIVGIGYETIELLIGAKSEGAPAGFITKSVQFLILLILLKIIATGVSLGAGFSGGVFSPSLFLGACLGYLVGMGANQVIPLDIGPPEAYAVVGMGTLFAGAAQAPLTAILMIFELTQDYKIILPLMLSSVISTIITRMIMNESIYTIKLAQKDIDIHQKPEELIMNRLSAEDVMRSGEEPQLHPESTLEEITQNFLKFHTDHLFVVDDRQHVAGVISLHKVMTAFSDLDTMGKLIRAVDVMDSDVPVLYKDTSLTEAMSLFWQSDYDELPVVESEENPKFLGSLWEHDIIGAYNREVLKQRETLLKTVHEEEEKEVTDYLELPSGYIVDQIPARKEWADRTIQELHFREREQVTILEVKRSTANGDWKRIPASPDVQLEADDLLVVLGPKEQIESTREKSGS